MGYFKDLQLYKKSFELAMEIFEVSKAFPNEEKYSLTDKIRRCSRSVCANFAEAFRRRRHPAHFMSKLLDVDAENSETVIWLDFALACKYVSASRHNKLVVKAELIGRLLWDIIKNPSKYS